MSISEHKIQHSTNRTPLAKLFYGGFETWEHSAGSVGIFRDAFAFLTQQRTKSLSWLATWTTYITLSCVLPLLMSMSWPTCLDRWTSRWSPCLTWTGRRCTVLLQSSSCCSTRESMVGLFSTWTQYTCPALNNNASKLKVSPLSFLHRFAVLCWSWLWKLWKQFHGSHWCSCLLHFRALRMCAEYIDEDAGEADRTQYISAGHVQEKVRGLSHVCDGQP